MALRSWARARLANSAAVARKSCIVDVLFVYRTCERQRCKQRITQSMAPL